MLRLFVNNVADLADRFVNEPLDPTTKSLSRQHIIINLDYQVSVLSFFVRTPTPTFDRDDLFSYGTAEDVKNLPC
jgi:hypothetical protein